MTSVFDDWIDRWSLVADGPPIHTASSDLLPVVRGGVPAMLKIARTDEEHRGAALMVWYEGDGAVRVLETNGAALLLERPHT
ncbi:MAG TPA: aminoglycoside phosphotransferase family protein, partial [Vicinamibacterales bacterium]|nr:aminoglycoside phosphotransferase family protein [Vicinamibacterales bacterium]